MPLSNKDLTDIAKEFGVTNSEVTDDKSSLPPIADEILKKEQQTARLNVLYRDSNDERVVPYQIEKQWLNGVISNPITQNQINAAAARADGNIFFPNSWSKSNAMLTSSANGNPTSNTLNNESTFISGSIENNGLLSMIDLLTNGQSSSIGTNNLNIAYSPGATSITLDFGETQTVGKLLYIAGSGTSALVRVTGASLANINIQEIIPPANTITSGSVVENIPGFSNSNRQTLTNSTYQRILTELTNNISSAVNSFKTCLQNQLTQLNLNIDNPSQTNTAKTNVNSGISGADIWLALSNTGVSGRFVDSSLNNLISVLNTRSSQIPSRLSQISSNLGTVSQNANGDYSGNGAYLQRFKSLNFLINSANGPMYQVNALKTSQTLFNQKIANSLDKLATFSNITRYGAFAEDSKTLPTIKITGAQAFAVSNVVLITGNDLPGIEATIIAISGDNVTLSKTIPKEYTKAVKAAIIKRI